MGAPCCAGPRSAPCPGCSAACRRGRRRARRVVGLFLAGRRFPRNTHLRDACSKLEGQLQAERARAARTAALEEALNLQRSLVAPTLAARVIAGSPLPGERTITIDRGTADGVEPNMAVIAGPGIVGRVIGEPAAHAAGWCNSSSGSTRPQAPARAHGERRCRRGRFCGRPAANGPGVERRVDRRGRPCRDVRPGRHLSAWLSDRVDCRSQGHGEGPRDRGGPRPSTSRSSTRCSWCFARPRQAATRDEDHPVLAVVLASVAAQVILARYAVGGRFVFDLVLVGVVFAALASGAVGGMLAGRSAACCRTCSPAVSSG